MPDQTSSRDQTADPASELLTIAEAAELLRAPVATLRYWRHLGTGRRSFRLGRRVLSRRRDLHAWIVARREQGRTGAESGSGNELDLDVDVEARALVSRARPRKADRASTRAEATHRRATAQKG